ncbi:MAG: NAD-dependent epimerase/dehydratase family protein [Luteitalea sp.]|nr:NAD-dependent epimerase/dehydratase family protein [Luteitalea sp.]
MGLLDHLVSEEDLEDRLSTPNETDIECCRRLDGDLLVLGAGGKMGPSLVRRIVRASAAAGVSRRVIAASRFSAPGSQQELDAAGATTVVCDLLEPDSVASLPVCPNVLFLAGRKFGSTDNTALTWAINTIAPVNVARHSRSSRLVVFSTGNVYPFVPVSSGGSVETDQPAPRGEYAQSCLGRERVFEYFSDRYRTPTLLFRLNYAVDLRYGVLVDIARAIKARQPVDRTVSHLNAIWQGDASSYALRALEGCASPPRVLNVSGPETLSVTDLAAFFGKRFGTQPLLRGAPSGQALLTNASACHAWLGAPEVTADALMEAVASWLERDGRTLDKPTRFEVTDGAF